MTIDPHEQSVSAKRSFYLGLVSLYVLVAALLALTWRRWPDAIVDFGRELYVPWRLSQGDVLYSDIAYFNGPLSPYFNSLLFTWFGTSVTTLIVANTILLLVLVTVLYYLLTRFSGFRTAAITCAIFLIVFAFNHAMRIGNYNYISPYSHEMTHGIVLIFGMMALLFSRYSETKWCQLMVGILWGCTFLGKAEIFLAASGMLITSVVLQNQSRRLEDLRGTSTQLRLAVAGALVPVLFFLWLLSSEMDLIQAAQGIAGTWYWVANSEVTDGEFYRRISGLDRPAANLVLMIKAIIAVGLICFAARSIENWRATKQVQGLVLAIGSVVIAAFLNGGVFPLLLRGRPFPLIALVLLGIFVYRKWNQPDRNKATDLMIVWGVMAGLMLAKFPLRVTVLHYGFVLAMPIVLLTIAWGLERLPNIICRQTGGATCYAVLCFILLADVVGIGAMTVSNMVTKQTPIGEHGDRLLVDAKRGGQNVADVIAFLNSQSNQRQTVLVLPEGVMINYLARRPSSSPYVNLCPPEFAMYGETNIRNRLAQSPADYVLLVNKDVREYGHTFFGSASYGKTVMDWIDQNYIALQTFGHDFAESTRAGVTIMKRRTESLAHNN